MFESLKSIPMKYLQNIDSFYLAIILLIAFIIGDIIVQKKKSLKLKLQYRLVFYGIVMMILLFSLPSTPSLVSFGYPGDVADIENKEKLLKLLQNYNDAIAKTTEAVHFMIFITVFWLLSIVSSIIKHFKLENPSQ